MAVRAPSGLGAAADDIGEGPGGEGGFGDEEVDFGVGGVGDAKVSAEGVADVGYCVVGGGG